MIDLSSGRQAESCADPAAHRTRIRGSPRMHPSVHSRSQPDKPACIMAGSGEVVTYRQLEERSNQGAHLLRSLGLRRGDVVALCMENHPRYLEIAWAAQRTGLYLVCISSKL